MKTSKASYHLFSYGLILMLIASFSLPTVAACAMAGQDCEKEMADCGGMVEDLSDQKSCPQQAHNSCDVRECTFKQTPVQANSVELNQAQINVFAAIAVSFILGVPEPRIIHSKKAQDFTALYSDSSPIYLMNRVLLN